MLDPGATATFQISLKLESILVPSRRGVVALPSERKIRHKKAQRTQKMYGIIGVGGFLALFVHLCDPFSLLLGKAGSCHRNLVTSRRAYFLTYFVTPLSVASAV